MSAGKRQPWANSITHYGEEAPEQLLANPLNPKLHPRHQQEALAGAIGELGWIAPVIVNETTQTVIDGHARIGLAISRQEASVPVAYVRLTPEQERLALLTFDPIGAMAATDKANLEELLKDVRTDDAALRGALRDLADDNGLSFGGEGGPHQQPEAEIDRAEELREKWQTHEGQLWTVGRHRLLCGDATKAADVVRLLGGERASLLATDPPFLVDYRGGDHPQSHDNDPAVKDKRWSAYREGDDALYRDFLRVALDHALTNGPAVYQWHAYLRTHTVMAAWEAVGLVPHQQIIWAKSRPILTHSHYMWQHEAAIYGWAKGRPLRQRPPANSTTLWQVNQQGQEGEPHPTQKPVELFRRPLEYHTTPGEWCYEPFSGSGTCLVAAEQTGRRCAALELSLPFVAVALERLAKLGLEPRLSET